MNAAQLVDYVTKQKTDTDVIIFSPQPDMGAFFLNIFEQNELFDPGFKESAQNFCNFAELNIDISKIVMDSRNIVFSNYFFAKPLFWRKWYDVCEILFDACENYPFIAQAHNWIQKTNYREGIQRKVFLIERIASLIISTDTQWKSHAHNPFLFCYSASRLNNFPEEAVKCDALKIAFNETSNHTFLKIYENIILKLMQK